MDSTVASLLLMLLVEVLVDDDEDESDLCLASRDVWREVNAAMVTMNISLGVIS